MKSVRGAEAWERYWSTPDPDRKDSKWSLYTRLVARISDLAEVHPISVVDVGCGVGSFLDRIRGLRHVTAVGIDFSPAAVRACGYRGHTAIEADAENLPVIGGGFDVLVAIDLFSCLEHSAAVLANWRDHVRDGGVILVADQNWSEALTDAAERAGYSVYTEDNIRVSGSVYTVATLKTIPRQDRRR